MEPPGKLGDEDRAELSYWMKKFTLTSARWACATQHGHKTWRILVTLDIPIVEDNDLPDAREAVDVAQLLVLSSPRMFTSLVREFNKLTSCRFSEALEAVERGVSVALRIKATWSDNHATSAAMGSNFFDTIRPFYERFESVRKRLLEYAALPDSMFVAPIPVTIRAFSFKSSTEATMDRVCRRLEYVIAMAWMCAEMCTWTDYTREDCYIPLVAKKMIVSFYTSYISPATDYSLRKLLSSAILVKIRFLSIDPRQIACDEGELCRFLKTISTPSVPRMAFPTPLLPIDFNGQNYIKVARSLLTALKSVGSSIEVDVGGLFGLFRIRHNRNAAISAAFQYLASRTTPVKSFTIGTPACPQLTLDDGEVIRMCLDMMRLADSNKKLRVQKIDIALTQSSPAAIHAIMDAFCDAESVGITNHDGSVLPETLRDVLAYPSLRDLEWRSDSTLESMDLFDARDLRLPVLHKLSLHNVALKDVSSLRRFVASLKPSRTNPSNISKNLKKLILDRLSLGSARFEEQLMMDLCKALKENVVLKYVSIWGNGYNYEIGTKLREYDGQLLPSDELSGMEKKQLLAFLSVIQVSKGTVSNLGSDLILHIFQWATIGIVRNVEVEFIRDEDEEQA